VVTLFWRRVDWSVDANVSVKRIVSIFRAEVTISLIPSIVTSALKMETVGFSETKASTDQSTRRQNTEKPI
jgi:hypothetical protein